MERKNIVYKKCTKCKRIIKYEHEEGFGEIYPLDPVEIMNVIIISVSRDDKDVISKRTNYYNYFCSKDCFIEFAHGLKKEDLEA